MKLSQKAIAEIEETLNKGGLCELLPGKVGIFIRHHPERTDIDFAFPLQVKDAEVKLVKRSADGKLVDLVMTLCMDVSQASNMDGELEV